MTDRFHIGRAWVSLTMPAVPEEGPICDEDEPAHCSLCGEPHLPGQHTCCQGCYRQPCRCVPDDVCEE